MSFPRVLSAHEQAVLRRALAADSADAERLRAQIPYAEAIADCVCGCASIDLRVKRASGVLPAGAPAVIAAGIRDTEGAGILVFVNPDGYLSLLEVYTHADEPIKRFPAPELIEPRAAERPAIRLLAQRTVLPGELSAHAVAAVGEPLVGSP